MDQNASDSSQTQNRSTSGSHSLLPRPYGYLCTRLLALAGFLAGSGEDLGGLGLGMVEAATALLSVIAAACSDSISLSNTAAQSQRTLYSISGAPGCSGLVGRVAGDPCCAGLCVALRLCELLSAMVVSVHDHCCSGNVSNYASRCSGN